MNNGEPIVVSQTFDASLDKAWRAITDRDEMVEWYFENIPAFKPEVGFGTQFNVHHNGRDFFHIWKVTEVVSGQKISYSWAYRGYEGKGKVIFELSEKDGGTKLTLTAKGMESFPQDIPEFRRESCEEGWNYFIRESLKEYLDK